MRHLIPAVAAVALVTLAGCATGSNSGPVQSPGSTSPATSATSAPSTTARSSHGTPVLPVHSSRVPVLPTRASSTAPSTHPSTKAPTATDPLPLRYSTGSATQLITVTATSSSSTDARLQTWTRSGGTWVKVGSSVHAYLGRSGTSTDKHEGDGNTPAGSFTLTEAFGYKADPGTALPYFKTNDSDWWISQPGSLYNTHQHCSSTCPGGLKPASPSEHLYYTQPNYMYAVVINYNTDPVVPGRGSAVFLHVETGKPTSGCVSVTETQILRILRWLEPSAHPRIMIGTT